MTRVNLTFDLMVGKLCLRSSDVRENRRCFKKPISTQGKSMCTVMLTQDILIKFLLDGRRCSLVPSPSLLFEFYSLLPFPAFLGKLYSPHLLVPEVHKMSKLGHPIPLLLKPFLFWCAVLYCWTQVLLLCPLLCSTTQINIKLNSSNCTVSKMQISTSLHILKKLPRFSCLNLLYFSVHSPFLTYLV